MSFADVALDLTLAGAGMVILGLLLAVTAPRGLSGEAAAHWVRQQVPALAAGAVTAGVVLAALAFRSPIVVWSVLVGADAIVIAYLVALPRGRLSRGDLVYAMTTWCTP